MFEKFDRNYLLFFFKKTSPIKKFDIPHVDTSDTTLVKLDKIKPGIMTKKKMYYQPPLKSCCPRNFNDTYKSARDTFLR